MIPTAFVPAPWMEHGVCRQGDPDLWFPDQSRADQSRAAKAICGTCPVIAPCLEWAMDHGETGIWGGTSEHDRKRIRARRNARRRKAA